MIHKSVLLDEVAEFFRGESSVILSDLADLNQKSAESKSGQDIFIDATLGLGGHSERILEENPQIRVIGIDKDKISLEFAKNHLARFGARFSAVQGSFDEKIGEILEYFSNADSAQISQKEQGKIYGILADLGISSPQVDNLERGFSFESPNLDMRMDLDSPLTAKAVINGYSKDELNKIFRDFGEIRNYQKVTNLILEARKKRKIESAKELCAILESHTKVRGGIHPATLIFQALRIEVNDELGALHRFLHIIKNANLKGTKIAIISFHSLEDRIVKEAFKAWSAGCICDKDALKCECGGQNQKGEILTKKPIVPSGAEISRNKRARSAKMRCFRFYG